MPSLAAAFEAFAPVGDALVMEAPSDWTQGRTLYGGMIAALMFEAVKRTQDKLAPLRSVQLTFVGPASGTLRFKTALLRRGRSSAIVGADCSSAEGTAARAAFVFGAARESKVTHDVLTKPDVAPPDACGPFRKEGGSAPRGFWNNFETRLASGARLFEAAAKRPEFVVWTRLLDAGGADPTTALLALADCLPPAAMTVFPQPGPISTMTWTLDIAHVPASTEGWRLLWSSSEHANDGYSLQNMALWDESRTLLAVGRQAVAIFV
ncbi:MAG: thioesterase family protein [Proteobacteria bacterium]|nr:thioesterase family protein [Pseudomonadota bacterium]